jgi:aminoglycoside phosphotransferase (APT) family kinase protein
LVRGLVDRQFPEWADLPIESIEPGGWDNRSFHLGNDMVIRLPSAQVYADQVEKEQRWLTYLAPFLPVEIPAPLRLGEPASEYPWRWSVYRWVDGTIVAPVAVADSAVFATGVAEFLTALQDVDADGGPPPGAHNFHRGGSLMTYDAQTRDAIERLGCRIDAKAAVQLWEAAGRTAWKDPPVWVHGDISIGNLLSRGGRLSGVIDFGNLAIGDPACDLWIAWSVFRGAARETFRSLLQYDPATWLRARAWTLWKALILAAGMTQTNAAEWTDPWPILDEVLY